MISVDEQQQLLALARSALESRVKRVDFAAPSRECGLIAGAFVTIHHRRVLRGCLGRLECDWPLDRLVCHLATVVADSDPRFEPVTPEELADIEIEISVLTPEQPITSIEEIDVGRHGLIVEQGYRRGLLLPQVAPEHGWDAVTFVEHTCRKAGLAPDAWRNGARLFVFDALVFGEQPV